MCYDEEMKPIDQSMKFLHNVVGRTCDKTKGTVESDDKEKCNVKAAIKQCLSGYMEVKDVCR